MQLFVCCASLLLLLVRCSCGSKLQVKELSANGNRNVLECLETLISVRCWEVHDFLIIFDGMDVMDGNFFQRFPNNRWELFSPRNNTFTGFSNVIIFTKNFDSFKTTMSAINFRHMNTRAKFIIAMSRNFASLEEIKTASKGIPAAMWKLDKTHVVYLVPYKEDVLAMTYFPFARNCEVGELELLDVWRGTDFEKGTELFPEKMSDIQGCVQYHSFLFDKVTEFQVRKQLAGTGEMTLGGVGGRLITIVAEKMNMKLHLLPEQAESWDVVINQIVQGKSLFSAAGIIPTASRLEILDLESVFMEESLTFGYITDSSKISWKNLVWPLSYEVWTYIGCTFLLFSGFIFMVNRLGRQEEAPEKLTILDSFGIFLGSSRVLSQSYFWRYSLGIWILYSYLINAFYNCGLVSFLTTPNEQRIINTYEDLLTDGIEFGGSWFHQEFYHDPSDPVMMKVYNNFKIWPFDERKRLLINGRGAVSVLKSYVYMYNNQTGNVNRQFRMLEEKAFTFHVPVSMRRGSPFTFVVHRCILRASESGLVDYWFKYYIRTSHTAVINDNTPSVITTRHLRGILYLYMTGLICSCVTFLGELIYHNYFSNRDFH